MSYGSFQVANLKHVRENRQDITEDFTRHGSLETLQVDEESFLNGLH